MTDYSPAVKAARDGFWKWHLDPQAGAERNAGIVSMRECGATLEGVGRAFGVSGERVRQICAKAARKRDPES